MKHFTRQEFNCKCNCGFNTVDFELAEVLEELREHFNKPVAITSGCRCESYNRKIGGSKNSQHKYGKAADIVVTGIKPSTVYKYLNSKYPDRYGIGKYSNWIHVDTRQSKARWIR
ncbi:MAG: hypothetical protein KAS32_18200 [Candidatus Peribacteraceae bacterium]|nr:hypothetical protein [Candidatus Peribacteraceae bacterium]